MEITQYVDLINDLAVFVKEHPVLSGLLASWVATSEGLPFVKKIKSNGLLHLVVNALIAGLKSTTSKKGA